MEVIRTIRPGEKGSQRLQAKFGERLIAVRYRKADDGQILTTVEVVVNKRPAPPPQRRLPELPATPTGRVPLRIAWEETELRQRVKQAGGWWDAPNKCWLLEYPRVVELGLTDRVISPA